VNNNRNTSGNAKAQPINMKALTDS